MLFDVLWLEGHLVIARSYRERRQRLEQLELAGSHWQTPPTTYGGGARVLQTARELGLEGVVAKRVDSPYRPGERSDAWRKVKVTAGQEFVVGGWLTGNGRLAERLGSLLIGYHDEPGGPFRYCGRVGSGIDESTRAKLEATLAPLRRDRAPFVDTPRLPDPVWTEPELVVEVGFHEWTSAGVLRAPRFRGIREDKDPRDVVREPT
jgi:bifunctional non-homologous end joining protein LigD